MDDGLVVVAVGVLWVKLSEDSWSGGIVMHGCVESVCAKEDQFPQEGLPLSGGPGALPGGHDAYALGEVSG